MPDPKSQLFSSLLNVKYGGFQVLNDCDSQSALKQAISNRKTMKNHIAQKTTEDVFLSFVIYQGDILKVLSCSMLVFKKCDNFTARVQTQEISTDF